MKTPITDAARSGDRRVLLVALRDHLATAADRTLSARDLVALSKMLLDLAREVESLDAVPVAGGGPLRLVDEQWDADAV